MSRARRYSECAQGLCKTRARYVADLCKKHIDRMPYPYSIRARSVQLTCKKYARFMSTKVREIAMFLSDGCITIDNMKAIRDDISTGTRRDMTSIRPPHSFPMPTSRIASDDPTRRRRSPRRTGMRRAKNFAFDIVAEALWPTRCAICDKPGLSFATIVRSISTTSTFYLPARDAGLPMGRYSAVNAMMSPSMPSDWIAFHLIDSQARSV